MVEGRREGRDVCTCTYARVRVARARVCVRVYASDSDEWWSATRTHRSVALSREVRLKLTSVRQFATILRAFAPRGTRVRETPRPAVLPRRMPGT